ncbi:MAG: methyltransferase domain-containing protein [Betaproteobacteria bacterium]|nr:methyltransferase domain-containing protein [Betaproteobacteria bacterium]
MRRLHIGGRIRTNGWEVLDASSRPEVDHVGDASDLSKFASESFHALYASHVLEHFDYAEERLLDVLKEWRRVLHPDGTLYVSIPDLDILAEMFLLRESLSLEDRWLVMRMMFGGHTDESDYHLTGLNEEFLRMYLDAAGFTDVRRVDDFGLFDDTSTYTFKGVPISCNVTARRRA